MSSPLNSHGMLSTSPKSGNNTFSLYAEASSTRRKSIPSIHDSPSLQRKMLDSNLAQAINFVPPRM